MTALTKEEEEKAREWEKTIKEINGISGLQTAEIIEEGTDKALRKVILWIYKRTIVLTNEIERILKMNPDYCTPAQKAARITQRLLEMEAEMEEEMGKRAAETAKSKNTGENTNDKSC